MKPHDPENFEARANRLQAELDRWHAACDKIGVPRDPDALIRHHRNSAAAVALMDASTRAEPGDIF